MKIVIILGVLLIAANAGFNINTDACEAEKYDNWDAVRFPIQGGSGEFDFSFEKLPQGWYANKDRVYIPKGKVQKNKYYSTKLTVYDRKDKQYLKRSLLLNYDNDNKFGKVFDADYDIDFDDRNNLDQFLNTRLRGNAGYTVTGYDRSQVVVNQASNVVNRNDYFIPSQPAPNQFVEPRREQIVVPNQYIPNQVIPNQIIPNQIVVPNYRPDQVVPNYRPDQTVRPNDDERRRNPYYDAFPGDDQVERIISNVDCSRIRDIINYVTQSGFGCKARADFLQKFQNKLQIKIAIFRTDAQKNRQPIFALQEQLKALKEQIAKINSRPDVDADERIRGYRSEIERHTRDRAGYQNEYRNSKDSVDRLRNEIETIRSNSFECRNGYDQEDRRIRQIEAKIAELEGKLRDLRDEKEQCRGRRDKHQSGVSDSDRRIEECNTKIRYHQDIIDGFEKKSRFCLDAINDYNKKIDDCRRENENGRGNAKELQEKIAATEEQIANYNRQADRLVRLFTEYEKYQNQFEGLINKHYYGCYQYTQVKDDRDDKYTAPSSAFVAYMKDIFGQVPNENIRARFSGSVNIRKNTIFSPAWTKVYGIPFTAGYGSNKDISEDNFSCIESSPQKLKVFSGRIEDVTKNVIQVLSRTGDRYTVHLGGCTKIESVAEKELPEKGSQIYFKGYERSEKNHYNGFHVTCY